MASDWKKMTWGDLATLEYGKALREYKNASGPYQVFGTNGPIGRYSEFIYGNPSVIVGRKGAYRGIHYSGQPFFVIDTAYYLRPKVEFDMRWAYYQLLTQDINSMDSGSAIPSTSRDSFYSLPVSVPPIEEQQAIVGTLSVLDDKIELNRRMNETLEEMARALFTSWFADFDPVRAKAAGEPEESICRSLGLTPALLALFPARLQPSELGDIPEGWSVKGLDEIADYLNGLALQKYPADGDDSIPVIKIAQLRSGRTVDADRASRDVPLPYIVDDGDVLFSWSGSLEVEIWCGGEGALNQHLFKVTSAHFPKWFYYLWTRHHLTEFRAIAANKATTMGHIQRKHLSDAKVLVPSRELIEMADGKLAPVVDRLIQTRVESRVLAEIRDTLLPKLISGELRVPMDDAQ